MKISTKLFIGIMIDVGCLLTAIVVAFMLGCMTHIICIAPYANVNWPNTWMTYVSGIWVFLLANYTRLGYGYLSNSVTITKGNDDV